MHPYVRLALNILAIPVGWLGGSIVNMSLVNVGHSIFPIEGIDPKDFDALVEVMPTLTAEFFVFPFLAHALGTLAGAIIAALMAVSHKMKFALAIGGLFLLGGIAINIMLPGPIWFTVADIAFAYIPMAWIGGRIGSTLIKPKTITGDTLDD
ncbi:MAG TPA: hypothetical protein DCX14_13780 [Flavobacteriales bacterium]|jgi:hypothetical protein|nr:hypothetical protein [Flavobacteriales bacterium]HAW21245.1 hypothetical protein [Flavobacteriales bacterium]